MHYFFVLYVLLLIFHCCTSLIKLVIYVTLLQELVKCFYTLLVMLIDVQDTLYIKV